MTGRVLGKGQFAKVEEAIHTILNVKVSQHYCFLFPSYIE